MVAQERTQATFWLCATCNRGGTVRLSRHCGVFQGINAVHEAHHAESPDCDETYYIRVSVVD